MNMQDYYQNFLYSQSSTTRESTHFLRPEQILVTFPAKIDQNRNAIIRLAASIRKYGILEPLTVKKTGEDGNGHPSFSLISGEKRLFAAKLAGLDRIPCQILPEDDRSCAISGILRNLQQGDLHFFEQAAAYRLLMRDFGLTQEEIARKMSVSQSAIANKLRLLRLSKDEQQRIAEYGLTERHARALLRLKTHEERSEILRRIRSECWNVASTEEQIDIYLNTKESISAPQTPLKSSPTRIEMTPQPPREEHFRPQKFALQSLTPLYNSIERVLGIFCKTGAEALCYREEGENSIRIVIEVPKNA
ncbi:MAG: ParB/RepB/Spo0J family partition protein [Ruminococcaceae bacterium]|nr:ParB/RepB/Spo0J family partition protein [Oscillospiraceae bacterium]